VYSLPNSISSFWNGLRMNHPHQMTTRRQVGFSLVEVMVGMVIALLGTIVIFQVFAVSEGQKRTTTGGSDAQQNGAYAMYMLERQIRMAGSGMMRAYSIWGCALRIGGAAVTVPATAPLPAPPIPTPPSPLVVAPVIITNGGLGNSDSVTIMYGSAAGLQTAISLSGSLAASATSLAVSDKESAVGIRNNDFILAVEQGTTAAPCGMAQVNADPAAAGPVSLGGGIGATFTSAQLVDLGQTPVMVQYGVQNGQLVAFDLRQPAGANNPTVIADSVVNIQAQYGVATANSSSQIIDQWVEPTGTWAAAALTPVTIPQIKAVRLAIVVRSGLREKPVSGSCTVTPTAPTPLPAVAAAAGVIAKPVGPSILPFTADGVPQDGCYRYKTFETVIPIPNVIWSGA
jgi:type IV pilus assembly protein PilW